MLKITTYKNWKNNKSNESSFSNELINVVQNIIRNVRKDKDKALYQYTKQFDKTSLLSLRVTPKEIEDAYNACSNELINDLEIAAKNIALYHKQQLKSGYKIEESKNSYVGMKVTPISDVGIYVPGGTAAYPSTVLMNAIPAKIAGVKRIVMITPPREDGTITPVILAAAKIASVSEIYKVGGAQGIAALAYGTQTIKKVSKIVGPGNIYVAIAKKEVFGVVGIDMIAGPSEILIYADKTSNPRFVAADLLSQAEHDSIARPILVTTSKEIINQVNIELKRQLDMLSRSTIAKQSLKSNGLAVLVETEEEAINVINTIAPEHLELLNENRVETVDSIENAGAIFIGPYSPEPLGDYMAGPNHTLPTNGTATFSSPLSVDDFTKKTSLISYDKNALKRYKNSIIRIATEEGLTAHANAIKVRFEDEDESVC